MSMSQSYIIPCMSSSLVNWYQMVNTWIIISCNKSTIVSYLVIIYICFLITNITNTFIPFV